MNTDSVVTAHFYDQLAPFYHLLYGDWEGSIALQGEALARLLAREGVPSCARVLDAACGIGTQALGLAARGYEVFASDLSPLAVERLRGELAVRGLVAQLAVDDLRALTRAPSCLAAILACDNSIPHLLTDADILQCFRRCYTLLEAGGVLVISVRDYAATPRVNPDVKPYGLRHHNGSRFLAVQVWEWLEGDKDRYDLRLYLTTESAQGQCRTTVQSTRYYAIGAERLMHLMRETGFCEVYRTDEVLFQPALVGRKA